MYKTLLLCATAVLGLFAIVGADEAGLIVHRAIDGPVIYDPVPTDIEEDVIFYDGAPQLYFPNLTLAGTKFAVRFTPIQACTLTYVQVVSYHTAGPAILHVMSNNGGNPGTDLIAPFVVTLNASIQYQSITLPSRVPIGNNDFHICVEYSQSPPPYVTSDGDGATEQRSKYKQPEETNWTALSQDLNFRAFVIYYGDDQVPPTINHIRQVLGFSYDVDHVLSAEITDGSGVASAEIHYTTDGANWNTVDMDNTSGDSWEGGIPHQDEGTTLLYYLTATDLSSNSNVAYEPPTAPGVPYVMQIVEGMEIAYDDGAVDGWWIVSDVYEDNAFAIRMTPGSYPAQVLMARVFVSDDTPFDFTINGISGGIPDAVLPGGGPIAGARESHGWAISEFPSGPTIQSGSFFLLFHWWPETPGNPGVAQDVDNILFRSYWYNTSSGWTMNANGEYMMRCIVATPNGIKEIGNDGVYPANFELVGNYPNPFNPSTDIKFLASEAANVKIEIFNITGQLVKTVLDEFVEAGIKAVTWDGTGDDGTRVNSGIYFSKLTAGNQTQTIKMVLMK